MGGADKKLKGNFWFLLPRPKGADEARRIRAYDSVSLHHARGACDIICFGSRCEFGTIQTLQKDVCNTSYVRLFSLSKIVHKRKYLLFNVLAHT